MARAYSLDLRERVVAAVTAGQRAVGAGRSWSAWQRREVVAAPARCRQSGGAEDGRAQALSCGAREGLGSFADRREAGSHAARSAKELADRGLVVSYYALWHFLQHEGVTFKKKPSRLRTGPAGRRQAA